MIRLRLHWSADATGSPAATHGDLWVRPESILAIWREDGAEYTYVEIQGRRFLVDEEPAEILLRMRARERE